MRIHFKFDIFERLDPVPPFLKDGLLISAVLHAFVLVIIMVSPYIRITTFSPQIKYDEPIIVNLDDVVVAKQTVLPPAPAAKAAPAKPDAASKQVESAPPLARDRQEKASDAAVEAVEVLASPAPQTDANIAKQRIGALEDLLASVDTLKKTPDAGPGPPVEIKKGVQAMSIDAGAGAYQENSTADFLKRQLSVSYIDAIRIKLRGCWNIDPGAKGIKDMKIVIATELTPDGNIKDLSILNANDYGGSPWFKAVADSARRALIVCSPYANLPEAFYGEWKNITFTFYPDKKSIQ